MTVGERLTVDELLALARRAAPFETLTREVLEGVLGHARRRLPVATSSPSSSRGSSGTA